MKVCKVLAILMPLMLLVNFTFIVSADCFGILPPTLISINVVDSKTNAIIPSATLKIIEKRPDGELERIEEFHISPPETFHYLFIPNDTIILIVFAEGYKESEPFIYHVAAETPKEGVVINHTFYLTPIESITIYINVKNVMNQPIKDANVNVIAIYVNESFTGKTNEKGIFSFSTRYENFIINVSAEGYKPFESRLKVLHNVTEMTYNVVLEYLSTVRLTIEVEDEAWRYIPRANVTLISEYGSFSKIAEKGIAEFDVPAAKYKLTVKKEGYQPYEEILNLSKPLVGGKVIQLMKIPIPWWQQYWYAIVGVAAIVCIIPLLLMVRRRHIKTIGVTGKSHTRNSHEAF